MNTYTLSHIVKKEFKYILRDKRALIMGLVLPTLFVVVYGFAATAMLKDMAYAPEAIFLAKYMLFMILALLTFLSILTSALEIGAGEKERGTLCSALRTSVSFQTLYLGKLITLMLQSLASLILNDVAIVIMSFIPESGCYTLFQDHQFVGDFVVANIVLAVCIAFFSSLELLVSFAARSFKEGQLFSAPVMLLTLAPFYYVMYQQNWYPAEYQYAIPFLNSANLMFDLSQTGASMPHVVIFAVVSIALSVVFAYLAQSIMANEKNLFRR